MFDNPEKIESIQNIILPEIEILYWKLEDCLSEGNNKKAKIFFDMFCYIGFHKKELLEKSLKKTQIKRLKTIAHELYGQTTPAEQSPIIEIDQIKPTDLPFQKEKEINDYLYNNPNILEKALKSKGRITGRETEIEKFKCDIVFEDTKTLYAIELKRDQSDHKAVSQLDKYCHYFYRKLRYNHFKEIQGVCIANGFCCWSINEFRRKKHWIFYMSPTENGIKLNQIF